MPYKAISVYGVEVEGKHIRKSAERGKIVKVELLDENAHYEYQVGDMSAWVEIDPKTLKERKE